MAIPYKKHAEKVPENETRKIVHLQYKKQIKTACLQYKVKIKIARLQYKNKIKTVHL